MSLEMLNEPISKFTNHDLTVASELTVSDAAKLMSDEHIDSVLVFENDQVIGIVTVKDIITKIVGKEQNEENQSKDVYKKNQKIIG